MFNQSILNTAPLNQFTLLSPVTSITTVAGFNDFELGDETNGFCVSGIFDLGPEIDLELNDVPRDHGQIATSLFHRKKKILIEGSIVGDDLEDLESKIDEMRAALSAFEGNLDIKKDLVTYRRFVATLINPQDVFAGRQKNDLTMTPFKLVFQCHNPFGVSLAYDYNYKNQVVLSDSVTVTPVGSFDSRPVIIVSFNSATAITAIEVKNLNTGVLMTLTRSFSTGDVLVIDSEQKTTKVNGVEVDYSGTFITLPVSSNTIRFMFSGSSVNANCTVKYKETYL